jgi:hypothetical protein
MNDIDVRNVVHNKLLKRYHNDPDAVVIDEFNLNYGEARADIAVINGLIHGYELKSRKDNLNRLQNQVLHYSDVMDKVTLIVDISHVAHAIEMIPQWWGVRVITEGARGSLHINQVRKERTNPSPNPLSLAKILWKDECLVLLENAGFLKGNKSKPRYQLWKIIADNIPLREIQKEVRYCIKKRKAMDEQDA